LDAARRLVFRRLGMLVGVIVIRMIRETGVKDALFWLKLTIRSFLSMLALISATSYCRLG
jgi:hypothetical protein